MTSYASIILDDTRLDRFRQAIRFRTVSRQPEGDVNPREVTEPSSPEQLLQLQEFIQKQFPVIHASSLVQHEQVNTYSRLYTVKGRDPALAPYLLASHMDVVPVDEEKWDYPPFEAKVVDGEIYGRGTLDMKATLFAILESLEHLLSKGFVPERTLYLAFGHDEEIGGYQGALKIAELLASRDVQLEFVLDEGTGIVHQVLPGLPPQQNIALIAVAEKGYATLELSVTMPGGHASVPARQSSIGVLANAVARLESSPQPCMFGKGPEVEMLKYAAPKVPFMLRMIMQNLWLFGRLMSWIFSRKPVTDALQRTTTAITMFHAGVKSNVIAQDAVATVNHRIHPAQSLQSVLDHDLRVINDPRVKVTVKQTMEVGGVSAADDASFGFQTIRQAVLKVYPDALIAPNLLVANTDSRHYAPFSRGVYKFMPWVGTPKIAELIHGNNERIGVDTYEKYLNFYMNVLLLADRAALG